MNHEYRTYFCAFSPFGGQGRWSTRRKKRFAHSRCLACESLENRRLLAGDLDPSFGGDGRVLTNIGQPGTFDLGTAVVVQGDGRTVVVGYTDQATSDFVVTRYNQDGSLDSNFGVDGIVLVDFGNTADYGRSVALDGSHIVVVGSSIQSGTGRDMAVARLDSAGRLDPTFGTGGKQTIDLGGTDYGFDVVLDGSDMILCGQAERSGTGKDFGVARLDSAGQLDPTFGTGGKQFVDFGSTLEVAYGVALDGSHIVLGGRAGNDFGVARLDSTGQLDTSFSTDGKQTVDFGGTIDHAYDVAVNDSHIVVAGFSTQSGTGDDFAVARLDSTGELDPSFGTGGKQTVDFGTPSDRPAPGSLVLDGGKVVVAGQSDQSGTGYDMAVARLDDTGQPDPAFGVGGKQTIDFGGTFDTGQAVALDGSNIVVAGYSIQSATGFDIAVAKLLGNTAPTADANGPYEGDEGSMVTLTAAGSTDPDGDDLEYRWDFESDGDWDTGWLSDPEIEHTWLDNGEFTVTLEVRDGELTDLTTATVTVENVAPVAMDDVVMTNEDTSVTFNPVINDRDAAGVHDPLTIMELNGVPVSDGESIVLASGGVVTRDTATRLTYTPAADFNGPDSVNYTIGDGDGGTAVGLVEITVHAVNDAPVNAVPGVQITNETIPLAISGLSVDDIDVDETPAAEMTVTLSVDHGTLTLVDAGLSSLTGNSTSTVVLVGSLTAINETLTGDITYLGFVSFTGMDALTITTNDQGNTGADPGLTGGSNSEEDQDAVAIQVEPLPENSVTIIDSFCGDPTKALVVKGSSLDDKVDVKFGSQPGEFRITIENGLTAGSMDMGAFRFEGTDDAISKVIVYGLDGNDEIKVHSDMGVMAWLFGGRGDDKLRGGKGDDVIIGGLGDDVMDGQRGRDLLIGGQGADKIKGNQDEDILLGGLTTYDEHLTALCAIMEEWTSEHDFATRVEHLMGTSSDGANGSFLLSADASVAPVTVYNDGDEDRMTGGSGADWLLGGDEDDIRSLNVDDVFTDTELIWLGSN